jgi:hypothetical protein
MSVCVCVVACLCERVTLKNLLQHKGKLAINVRHSKLYAPVRSKKMVPKHGILTIATHTPGFEVHSTDREIKVLVETYLYHGSNPHTASHRTTVL